MTEMVETISDCLNSESFEAPDEAQNYSVVHLFRIFIFSFIQVVSLVYWQLKKKESSRGG